MKKFAIITILMLGLTSTSFALLPPLYHSVSEIEGMFDDPQLGKTLHSGEAIMKIERTDEGFRITTTKHAVDVKVETAPQRMPGPAKFRYTFGTPQVLPTDS